MLQKSKFNSILKDHIHKTVLKIELYGKVIHDIRLKKLYCNNFERFRDRLFVIPKSYAMDSSRNNETRQVCMKRLDVLISKQEIGIARDDQKSKML